MIEQFNAVIAALQSFFSKDYLLQGLLPVFVLLMGMFALLAPGNPLLLRILLTLGTDSFSWRVLPFAFFLLFVWALFGWIWWAVNPWFRSVLEGDIWGVRRILEPIEAAKLARYEERIITARSEFALYTQAADNANPATLLGSLVAARVTGAALPPRNPSKTVLLGLRRIANHLGAVEVTPISMFQALGGQLRAELSTGNANAARQMDDAHAAFEQFLLRARDKAEAILDELSTQRYFRFPTAGLGATELANRIRAQEALLYNSYQFDARAFMPHILLKAAGDTAASERLIASTSLLGTAVAFSVVFAVLAGSTIVATAVSSLPVTAAVLAWTICPLASYAFYRVSIIGARAMMENVRAVVDTKRFDLLTALHVQLPANPTAERAIWEDLSRSLLSKDYDPARVTYHHS